MQIVIDIDEKRFQDIQRISEVQAKRRTPTLEQVVANGNPQEPKTDRLYSWLSDMRLGIAPDETTPQDERAERLAQVDIIDEIMEWLESEG